MVNKLVYLDIETTSGVINHFKGPKHPDYIPIEEWSIISLQWQEVEAHTGKELGDLKILRSWEENSELDFLKKVLTSSKLAVNYTYEYYDKKEQKQKESSTKFIPNFLFDDNPPVLGFNLKFEQEVLESKMKQWNISVPEIYSKKSPRIVYSWNIDLMSFAAMRSGRTIDYKNNKIEFEKKGGTFRGSSLQNISCKENSGDVIQLMYDKEDWKGIEDYIRKETKCAIETYRQLLEHMKDWNYK